MKDRNASAAPSGNPERDKRFESCETDMRVMLGVDANILPHLAVWSILFCPPPSPVCRPKSTPETAFCHEIADFALEAPGLEMNNC